jgi:Platelet-activating factor acetylhydrolase, isoform II
MRNDDVPGFIRAFLLFVLRRAGAAHRAFLCATLLAASPAATLAQGTQGGATFPVGIRELEYIDPHEGGRHLTQSVFYPAAIRERPAAPFVMPFFTKLNLYRDAEPAFGTSKHPLVMFSHGRGSNGLYYAWFAEFLAAHGYIVAALNHYRANTYDSTIAYLANKLWQRPRDIGLSISFLLNDPFWGKSIDADRRRRPFARRLHRALGRRREDQSRQVPRLPTRLAQQSDDAGISAQRTAARRGPGARCARQTDQGRVCNGAGDRAGLRHG